MSVIRCRVRQVLHHLARTMTLSLALVGGVLTPTGAADISYVYDHTGRVLAVIDPATDTAIYAYDAVGNLTGITRQPSATLAILQFTPASGPVGTLVTIYGTGFSATPASNTVKFNGTTATVLTASTTVLTATVPSGATTGPLSVTVGANTVASAVSFTVGTSPAPTIATFSPTVGPPGTAVTITGTNYNTSPTKNKVMFSPTYAVVSAASATSLSVTVPVGAQSGTIGVATVHGGTLSTNEFFVTPAGVAAANVQFTGRIVVGGSSLTATISTANKVGLVVFDGVAGQRVNLGMTSVSIPSSTVSFYKPDGTLLWYGTYGSGGGALDSPVLPFSGTYSILIDPASTYTGSMTLTLSAELTGTIIPGGAAVPIAISRVGQNARYTFTGTAGQTISLGVTPVTITSVNLSILKPDGTTLVAPTPFSTSGGAIDSQVLAVSGTYAILIDPVSVNTGNVTIRLYNTPDVTGTIMIDGAAVTTPALTIPGRRARYTFTGTAGTWVNLGLTAVTISSSTVSMLNPDGTTLVSTSIGTSGGSLDPTTTLPATGTYTIVVDPTGLATGAMTLTLTSPVTGTITLDGATVPLSLTKAGRTARYTFSGTSGQWLSLGLAPVTIASSTVTILNPNGSPLAGPTTIGTTGGGLEPTSTLPTTGTYTIVVDPAGTNTGNITLKLMSYLSGTLNLNGAATTTTITPIGRNALYTFAGTAGQWVSLGLTAVTITSSTVTLWKPDGTSWWSTPVGTTGGSLDAPTALQTTGTYTVTVNPAAQYTGAMTLTLSTDVTGTRTINVAATPVTISRAGQNARITFTGTANQQATVKITGNTLGSISVNLYTPAGIVQTSAGSSATNFNLQTVTLATTGTYTITINPQSTATGSLNLQVTSP